MFNEHIGRCWSRSPVYLYKNLHLHQRKKNGDKTCNKKVEVMHICLNTCINWNLFSRLEHSICVCVHFKMRSCTALEKTLEIRYTPCMKCYESRSNFNFNQFRWFLLILIDLVDYHQEEGGKADQMKDTNDRWRPFTFKNLFKLPFNQFQVVVFSFSIFKAVRCLCIWLY